MKIRVLINYGGSDTRERRILPGVYNIDDPALFGAGRGLVERGQAVVIEDDKPVTPVTKMIEVTITGDDGVLDHLKFDADFTSVPTMDNLKSEITDFLDSIGIAYTATMTKSELLDLIPDDYYGLDG